jgi:hypothetical protein
VKPARIILHLTFAAALVAELEEFSSLEDSLVRALFGAAIVYVVVVWWRFAVAPVREDSSPSPSNGPEP